MTSWTTPSESERAGRPAGFVIRLAQHLSVAWLIAAVLYASGPVDLPEPTTGAWLPTLVGLVMAVSSRPTTVGRRPDPFDRRRDAEDGEPGDPMPAAAQPRRPSSPTGPAPGGRRDGRPSEVRLRSYRSEGTADLQCHHCGALVVVSRNDPPPVLRCSVCAAEMGTAAPPGPITVVRSWLHRGED